MKKLGLNQIREMYLSFFENKDHLRLPSFSLIPKNDKSLLLINSGMAPLKPYFTGQEIPPKRRITTCQKCIRTPDIERVGKTARHATFFEMLGNFSFGDYFKREAISWAWEFVTEVLELPKEKLWVSIYEHDDEAFEIWNKEVGVPEDRIVRLGKDDNFWEIGLGPCGPCSEIYYDRGEGKGCGKPDCKPGCDCDRYLEFWNLVFTQFDKDEKGNYNRLPNPNIDTGMGLERIAAIMQDVDSVFEVDTVKNILDHVCKIAGVPYKQDNKKDISIRVITDHIRGVTFMISDGILPSNEGRGYVLRRLLRRAARHGKLLGIEGAFLHNIVDTVVENYKDGYPELVTKKDYIKKIVKIEEDRFNTTVDQGLNILSGYMEELREKGEKVLAGDKAFKLYDTYGFPLDLTKEILEENGMIVDEDGFSKEMEEQKERARAARQEDNSLWNVDYLYKHIDFATKFVGYEKNETDSKVLAIVKGNELVEEASEGETVNIILDVTPFYAESGGQVGDTGKLFNEECEIEVLDCKKISDKIVHISRIKSGKIKNDDGVIAKIDVERRLNLAKNHTATHLLHKALKEVLGEHVNQGGSLVLPDRLRFDYTHYEAPSHEDLMKVEALVNQKVFENLRVVIKESSFEEAKKEGAIALFDEKYGDIVRMVNIGGYSVELCGGTHLDSTVKIGIFKIVSEGSVGAGLRRIEALTGKAAYEFILSEEEILNKASSLLKSSREEITQKISDLQNTLKAYEKAIEELKSELAQKELDNIERDIKEIGNLKVLVKRLDGFDIDTVKNMGDMLKAKYEKGVFVFAIVNDQKINFVAMANKKAVEGGINCGQIIKEISKLTAGNGGGRPDMAQGGGKDIEKLDEAMGLALQIIKDQYNK